MVPSVVLLAFFLSCQPVPKEVPLEKYRRQHIEGQVFIEEGLKARAPKGQSFLLISVRNPEESAPLAVLKVKNPEFPYRFKITGKHKLDHQRLMEGEVLLTARLSSSDAPQAQKGDLIGFTTAKVGSKGIRIVLNQEVE